MFRQTHFTGTARLALTEDEPHARRRGNLVSLTTQRPALHQRYAGLSDWELADRLVSEDAAFEAGLSPFDRLTCPAHRRWVHECIASPQHVSPVTGHRWCRDCASAVNVAVDELSGNVTMTCPRCRCAPEGIATRQIVRACQASLAAAHRRHVSTDSESRWGREDEQRCA